ncbi:tetratricopeptide repeat protein [Zwartia sp.]|uniref:O-linked N-acetylglucosamine transferase, SPINDLY family protein n=1 Tax=Zwartia sp. TaxID=2978004 RepID=UPI003BAE7B45
MASIGREVSAVDALKAHSRFQEAFALHQQGDLKEARVLYERALKWQPNHFDACHMLATLLYQMGQLDRAETLFIKALKIDPEATHALNNFGNLLKDIKKYKSALACFDKALAIDTHYVEAHNNRGDLLQHLGRWFDALESYERAITLSPKFAAAHYNRGNALGMMGRFEEAVASHTAAIEIDPQYAQAYMNRGNAQNELGQLAQAVESFDRAIQLAPDIPYLLGTRLHVNMQMCDWRHYQERLATVLAAVKNDQPASLPFPLLALTSGSDLQQRAAQHWIRTVHPSPKQTLPFSKRSPKDRLRIGYFSADFRQHPVAQLIAGLFEAHDRAKFEVYAFSSGPDTGDAMRLRLEQGFEHFIDVKAETDAQVIARARALELDIAIDLSGLTTGCRPSVFAARVAPLQINYLGHPGTMGAPYMDYIVADTTIITPETEPYFSEKVIYLPHSYQPNDRRRAVSSHVFTRAELGLPTDAFVFCCFNNNFKITPETFDHWMSILRGVPNSVLWLLKASAHTEDNLRREATNRGVSAERLFFAPKLPMDQHLARQKCADLFLDTLPYNAHTTTSDALWVGLPVLTCMGEAFASRVAASLLRAIDLPELITADGQAFEARAIELASDPTQLNALRDRLAVNRMQAPLFDIERLARSIESAYEQVHARRQAGQPPVALRIADTH